MVKVASNLRSHIILWSVDSLDWESRDADLINKTIMDGVHNGAIVLMHDIHQATAEALPELLETLEKEGYQFITVSELLNLHEQSDIGPYRRR
ncbi:hypothetical protein RYX56_16565 [Alkalihalophilus lindianensis]|uniref:NodB homology domain-containing protein n=1 Tax=Alkalihalophilus lindianensis TaxID=1630542 RepID=A0ABU3XEE9_9BACI|nr:hypothetical protein [Alkalihalophilus lindianensis]MDV2685982.1 hypothetical protein [Alkalihalophilus lindianensis]